MMSARDRNINSANTTARNAPIGEEFRDFVDQRSSLPARLPAEASTVEYQGRPSRRAASAK
jgi:hypothetical protein